MWGRAPVWGRAPSPVQAERSSAVACGSTASSRGKKSGNTRTCVSQAEFHSLPIVLRSALNFDTQPAAVVSVQHGFVGVLHEIEEGLFAQAFVERNERQPARVVAFDLH